MDTMAEIRAQLQARVPEPIQYHGFFMSKGAYTAPQGAKGMLPLMGLFRKKKGGDLVGTSTSNAVFGFDNHQTALVLSATSIYAIDTTTSMSRQMTFGNVLAAWPRAEVHVEGFARPRPGDLMLLSLELRHTPTGAGGQLEAMAYTNLGDPTWDCYRVLVGA